MPRPTSIPVCPDPPPPKSINTYSYQIELITPLFGGGVIARENDPSFPIRPTSIRGQLQFWWRATIGAQHLTKEDLRAAQTSLWGGVTSTGGQPSRVLVGVTNLSVGKATPCAEYKLDGNRYRAMPDWDPIFRNKALPYALFPFQGQLANRGTDIEIPPAEFIGKASFKLTLGCSSSLVEQIKPALWAWVNLGGLGSRTRRGCGAIRCTEFSAQDRNDLIAQLRRYLSATPPKDWPTLAEAALVGKEFGNPIEAWDAVIKTYRDFRQGQNTGRNPGHQPNRPGRSRWPEPETIRRITGKRSPSHPRMSHIPDNAFPRAELGLPIVFHFKDRDDPPDTVLYPAAGPEGKRERMASPLILKPVALKNGKFVPVIVRLKTPLLTGVELRKVEQSLPLPKPTYIRDPKLAEYANSPLQNRSNQGSALEAFLAFAGSKGFTKV